MISFRFILLFLLTAIVAHEVVAEKKEVSTVGTGPYIALQAGGGLLLGSVDGRVYDYEKKDGYYQYSEISDTGFTRVLPGMQLIWGYTHRWGDFTMGVEAALISPAIRFGYVFLDRHQISVSGHFAPVGYGAMWGGIKYASLKVKADPNVKIDYKEVTVQAPQIPAVVGIPQPAPTKYEVPDKVYVDPELTLDTIDPEFSAASGLGFSLMYEYFSRDKLFFRSELRFDYYGVKGVQMVDQTLRTDKTPVFSSPFNGDLSVWDVSLYVGLGAQW